MAHFGNWCSIVNKGEVKMKKWMAVFLMLMFVCSMGFAMTKSEIISDLQGKSFVSRLVGDCQKVGDESGIGVYHQCYLEVAGDQAQIKKVAFYVVDEGKDTEAAYYLVDQIPTDSVTKTVAARQATAEISIKNV